MTNYRRNFVRGGSYFFTVNLADRRLRHSSFHRMVRLGVYPEDWAGDLGEDGTTFGER
jgi:hypothetical protein